jgi:hypothetical protein
VAVVSKLTFIGLVLSAGSTFLQHQAGVAVAVDLLFVTLLGIFLLAPGAQSKP